VRELNASRLLGRGGAAFPTGKKSGALHAQISLGKTHYVICNADESEPGTFKDRIVMEGDPFALIEGMSIIALAAGARQGYIYIRGEYPLATETLRHAIQSARADGVLGDRILGKDLQFDIELRRGAGATSAEKKPLCSIRSKVIAVNRGTNRRFPRSRASFAGRPSSTT